ncbi:TetR/AcrR family transcriptional regulator [Mycolicibacterium arenosum]
MPTAESKSRRRRVDGEASQQRILQAATEIAAERGYEGTSINLVSERSGLPASSIYWHFKDKDALIAAVIDHSFQSWLAKAGGQATEGKAEGSVDDQLSAMMQSTAKALEESSDFLRLGLMLTLERREREPTARRRFLAVREEALERTVASFARLFPGLDDHSLHQLGSFTMAAADGLFIANEIDESDAFSGFELLAAAIHGAARHLLEGAGPA